MAELVDAWILISVTIAADPDYFGAASLVIPSHNGKANMDAMAQLARELLRFFEQGLGKQLARDRIPGVQSLAAAPFDDLWRLIELVVAVTLLSERNQASVLYEQLDGVVQTQLRLGIDELWGSDSAGNSWKTQPSQVSGYAASTDSMASAQTSLLQQQQFASAMSSLHSSSRHSAHDAKGRLSAATTQQSVYEPAVLPISQDVPSVATIAPFSNDAPLEQSLIGFDESISSRRPSSSSDETDTSSYVSEFSQDLAAYGPEVVSTGIGGPNALAAYVFIASLLAYAGAGGYLMLFTAVPQRTSPVFKSYYDMTTAIAAVLTSAGVSAGISIAWVHLLRLHTRRLIWLTTLSVPVAGAATAVWACVQLFRISGAPIDGILGMQVRSGIVAAIALILAVRFVWAIVQRRLDIERSVDIIKLACSVLVQNSELYAFSLLLLALYTSFSMASAAIATRLPLLLTSDARVPGHVWGLMGFLLTSFAWTSAVFVQLLRAILSSVVCQWYFHRHDPNEPPVLHTLQAATYSALTRQLGTIAFAAAVLLLTKLLHLIELLLRWAMRLLRFIPLSFILSMAVGRPVYLAERWSSFVLVYAAFTGRGFMESSRTVTPLLRRHHLLHSPVVSLIKSSVTCYSLLLSLVFGYALGVQAVLNMSAHAAFVAVAGSAMPFVMLQMVTHVLSCCVEALVVCYAIDLDVESCHSINVVETLSLV
ncbi:hypothetical protein EV183_005411 [Coemansia sp. RSA 2336]|nr:hypothetical protein EV183_005411 [Coemansia sp. RSA 2336]